MTSVDHQLPSFEEFFFALWRRDPFPWQSMLARRAAAGTWPEVVSLPTAAGKTACLDIGLYALACQSEIPLEGRTAPRRIWFVVDRRVVVDATHDRAMQIARKLAEAHSGPLAEISRRLKKLSGTDCPLAVARLRGGIPDDRSWARLPSQAAVITSTVDQLGSRLLFRNYASHNLSAPIYAGLAAHDSLIILDEAHCAAPFSQTLEAVRIYRGDRWAERPLRSPFGCVLLSATPPAHLQAGDVFPGLAKVEALDHPLLRARLSASKPAALFELAEPRQAEADVLETKSQELVQDFVKAGYLRIAVMVNRVATAQALADRLRNVLREQADVLLLTGRLRPFDRDTLIAMWLPKLRADAPERPDRPIVTVATQCLEVGADLSFDALVTEAASLDALRQRFGRLNRQGDAPSSPAAILIRRRDLQPKKPDPVYGDALPNTWQVLKKIATVVGGNPCVDFGVSVLDAALEALDAEELEPTAAPAPDAPVLLPAHLDLLCQTSPTPAVEPDVSLFLHGKERGAPEVYVVWRADLDPAQREVWTEAVALCPPLSAEMLAVPLYRLRLWLASRDVPDTSSDIEGLGEPVPTNAAAGGRSFLIWRGRDRSVVRNDPHQIDPGDVIILPAVYGMQGLGQAAYVQALGRPALDVWECALAAAGRLPAVRIHRGLLEEWLACPPLKVLVELAESPQVQRDELFDAIEALRTYMPASPDEPPAPPTWWLHLLEAAATGRIDQHPAGGIVLTARRIRQPDTAPEPDLFADEDDLASAADDPISLEDHTQRVVRTAQQLATLCLPTELRQPLVLAALWHDSGKLDERFQILLHQGDAIAALTSDRPLAKSPELPTSPSQRQAIRIAAGLPDNFRHEMLSVTLARLYASFPDDEAVADLVLHLIATHHGHARPFAPICIDLNPPDIIGRFAETEIEVSAQQRVDLPPAHRLDSHIPERFWRNTRRYGWWGLAYLEAILRLADWYASAMTAQPARPQEVHA